MISDEPSGAASGTFAADPTAPTGTRFRCAACGADTCVRVTVKRPNGTAYVTEFVSCANCRAVFHWPGEVPLPAPSAATADGPAPGSVPFGAYGMAPRDGHAGVDDEQLAAIKAAAERATKSRGRRSRR